MLGITFIETKKQNKTEYKEGTRTAKVLKPESLEELRMLA
jgi:hypothetical protein